jgi:hypothetical protein
VVTSGDVFDYPYLWKREQLNDETEGRKSRPCTFIAVVTDPTGASHAIILAITASFDGKGAAIEIPRDEKRKAGLEADKSLWIVITEYNHDIIGASYYFLASQRRGQLSAAFTRHVLAQFMALARATKVAVVNRNP